MGLVVLIQYTSLTDKQLERWNRTTATSAHYSERSAVTKIIATVAVQVQIQPCRLLPYYYLCKYARSKQTFENGEI